MRRLARIRDWNLPRERVFAVTALVIVAGAAFATGVANPFADDDPLVLASAPKESSGLTLFLKAPSRWLGEEQAEYEIRYGERVVYPPGGKGAVFDVPKDGTATTFVPFDKFVVGNGDYTLVVRYDGKETHTRVPVDKWVSYVYLHPFDKGPKIQIDVQLSRTTGGLPNDRVLTKGELVLEIRYRGRDGNLDPGPLVGAPIKVETDPSKSFTRIDLSRSRFNEGSGYYSIEPVFHNYYARGNLWVPKDPTLAQRDPPWNWIHIK